MIAARLSSVWQVAGVAAAALCCYLVSQSVASERASLGKVNREIASTQYEIAKLSTEIGARARFTQLESWNGTFGLKAPRPGQYVDNGVQLASLYGRKGQPALQLDPRIVAQQGATSVVSYHVPAPAAPVPTQPPRIAPPQAMPAQPAPDMIAPQPQVPMLRTAAFVRPRPSALAGDPGASVVTRTAFHPPVAKPAAASLLPDDIGDLIAREEAKGAKTKSGKADR